LRPNRTEDINIWFLEGKKEKVQYAGVQYSKR